LTLTVHPRIVVYISDNEREIEMAATTSTLRRGTLASYHGSRPTYHGIVFRIADSYMGHYDLAYAHNDGQPDREIALRHVRRSSLTPVNAREYWASFRKCPGCEVEFRGDECPTCS
jgi:hypothetical protein